MQKYAKWTIFGILMIIVAVCVFFCFTPKTAESELKLVQVEEGEGYSTQPLCEDFYIFNTNGETLTRDTFHPSITYYTGSSLIFDVVLLNFKDAKAFTETRCSGWVYDSERVSDYFKSESQGKLNVDFNIHVADINKNFTDYNIHQQNSKWKLNTALFDTARQMAHTTLKEVGEPDCKFLVVSLPEDTYVEWSTLFWPHALLWGESGTFENRMVVGNSNMGMPTICHEIYHILGLPDLYSYTSDYDFVGTTDMMGTATPSVSTSAYYKQKLGWYDESTYGDSTTSNIENISTAGTYTLDMPSIKGVNAYKFGVYGNEYFLVEPRMSFYSSYLIINRINTKYTSNAYAKSEKEAVIYAFPDKTQYLDYNDRFFEDGETAGKGSKALYYSNGRTTSYYISDIDLSVKDKITFSFSPTAGGLSVDDDAELPDSLGQPSDKLFLSVKDYDGADITPTNILVYNDKLKKWEDLEVGKVYVGNKQYFMFERPEDYTKISVIYKEFTITQQKMITIYDIINIYSVQFEKTMFTDVGEFIKSAQTKVSDFFSNIFKFFKGEDK